MTVSRREFLQCCAVCGAALTIPGCCCRHYKPPCPPCPPLPVTPPRGLDPPNPIRPQLPAWPTDPEIEARKAHLRGLWLTRPRPLRQDGMWPYLLIRGIPGDHGARPGKGLIGGWSPDIMVASGFPTALPATSPLSCDPNSPWTVYVRVWNLGRLSAFAVALRVYTAWCEDLSHSYHGFQLLSGMYLNLADKTQKSCEQLVQIPVPWIPAQNAPPTAKSWALIAVASAVTDATPHTPPALGDLRTDRHVGSLFLGPWWSAVDEGDLNLPAGNPLSHVHYQIQHNAVSTDKVGFKFVVGANANPNSSYQLEIVEIEGPVLILKGSDQGTLPTPGLSTHTRVAFSGMTADQSVGGFDCLDGGDQVTFTQGP